MSRRVELSALQAIALISLTMETQSYILAPQAMAEYVNQDLWISMLISIFMSVLLVSYIAWLVRRFTGRTVIQFSEILLGRFFGKIVGGGFFAYFVTVTVINVQFISHVFKIMFMPLTPFSTFVIMILIFAYYCSIQGVGTLARMSTVMIAIGTSTILFFVLYSLKEVKLLYYLPIMQHSWSKISFASLFPFAFFGQVVSLTMVYPYIQHRQRNEHSTRPLILGIVIPIFIIGMWIIEFVGIFSANQLKNFSIAGSEMNALVQIGEFFERMDAFFIIVWLSFSFLITGFYFTLSHIAFTQLLNRSESHGSRIILVIAVFLVGMLFQEKYDRLSFFLLEIWVYLSIVFQAGIPLLLGLIYFIKKRGSGYHDL